MLQNSVSSRGSKYGRIGDSIPRVEDLRLLTGQGRYTDDMVPSGCSYLVFVRSPHAHAKIHGIDTTAALKLPGVSVITGADLQAGGVKPILNPRDSLGVGFPSFTNELVIPPWRALAVGKARHVGEAVALVVAPTEAGARDAAEAVQVDYDPLKPVIEIEDAEKAGVPQVWDELRGNQLFSIEAGDKLATDAAFARAAQVVEIEVVNNRVIINYLEPRSCVASYDAATQRLLVHIGSQGVHQQAIRIAHALSLPLERVRLTTGDVGGGFGGRSTTYPEYIACAYTAYKLGRPVRWCATRSESFISDIQARDHVRGRVASALRHPLPVPLPPDDQAAIKRLRESYDAFQHATADSRHRTLVPDRLVDLMALAGTPEEVRAQVERVARVPGIDRIAILPQVPGQGFQQREQVLRMFAEDVMARVS